MKPAKECAISVGPIKKKLSTLDAWRPELPEHVHLFGKFLASRLGEGNINPLGFVMGAHLAVDDLLANRDVPSQYRQLLQLRPEFLELLPAHIPILADAVCPPDFAKRVRKHFAKIAKNSGT
ncbi:MAG: hypothetical protein V1881_02075 [Candidatus Micrarchaeota archaeon]